MFRNSYFKSNLLGSHKNLVNRLNEKDLLDSLQLLIVNAGITISDPYPTDPNYKKEFGDLVSRFVSLRDDVNLKKDKDYLEKLRELASDFIMFEFKVKYGAE